MSGKEGKLQADTLNVSELWARIYKQGNKTVYNPNIVIHLLDQLEQSRRLLFNSVQENHGLLDQISRLKRQIGNYELSLDQNKEMVRQLQADLAAKCAKVDSLNAELEEHQRVFQAANNELQNAVGRQQCNADQKMRPEALRSNGRTTQKGKRRSSSPFVQSSAAGPSKRSRRIVKINEEQRKFAVDESTESDGEQQQRQRSRPSKAMSGRLVKNRSMSESNVYEPPTSENLQQQQLHKAAMSAKQISTLNMHFGPPRPCVSRGWTKGKPINQCVHTYVPVSNLFSAAFSCCGVCARGLGIRGFRCSECKLQVHEHCRQLAPPLCVPMVPTPQRCNNRHRPTLGDLAPVLPPRIPGQIIRCVYALEQGFLDTVGLYRVPGYVLLKKLKDQFNSKFVPKLDQTDPETITGYIKKFLRDCREPLIPLSSYREFLKAAIEGDEAQLKTFIEELPMPHRDTLAFLCAHWQRVAMHSNENQMPLTNLAKVLGPTVVGTNSRLLTVQDKHQQQGTAYMTEATNQIQIMQALLSLDHAYWTEMYDGSAARLDNNGAVPPVVPKHQWQTTPTSTRGAERGGHLVQSIVR
ncbi:hypothetical protein niasHS_001448 [Heterodera schachtii]|uniref:Rac GTPase-activating protein 1 n=1 Tax=Heterodera schachtii TaxID=97005 RepID=A0ABD2KE50_HETSC